MTELDFDELDKAVNNLMGSVDTEKRTPSIDEPEERVVELSSQDDKTSPSDEMSPLNASSQTGATAVATTPLAVKRRGQFMDIMHPSVGKVAPSSVSRQGVSLAPVTQAATEEQTETSQSPVDLPASQEVAPIETVASFEQESTTPDSVSQPDEKLTEAIVEAPADASDASSSDLPQEIIDEVAVPAETDMPLQTPFLADAKVEKRPLGSLSTMPDPIDMATSEVDDTDTPTDTDQTAVDMPDAAAPTAQPTLPSLPAELDAEIVALESSTVTQETTLDSSQELTSVDSTPAEAAAELETVEAAPAPTPTQHPAGGSIAQQYTEQPNSGDQSNGAIYDTATYHKGVETPVKKKQSPIVWVIWALALPAIGAAAAAAVYFLLMYS